MLKLSENEKLIFELLEPIYKRFKIIDPRKNTEREIHDLRVGLYLAFQLHSSLKIRNIDIHLFPRELETWTNFKIDDDPDFFYRLDTIKQLIEFIRNNNFRNA